MKKIIVVACFFLHSALLLAQQGNDLRLNRDSVLGWSYLLSPVKAATGKNINDNLVAGAPYTLGQQQMADLLFSWVQQSVAPRGLVIRKILRNNEQWWLSGAPALHSYGLQLTGFAAHFVNGKLDLRCCEIGLYLGLGVNAFPGDYIAGFNPNGLYLFAELPTFAAEEDDKKLAAEGIDKKIMPELHAYRTYLEHFHNNGKPFNRIGVVVTKNGDWPFTPVLVKDAIEGINQQLNAYPGIAQKNPYAMESIRKALDRLKPYANEPAKLRLMNYNNAVYKDEGGHAILDPNYIINGSSAAGNSAAYRMLVSTTRQTIDQSKTDTPGWLYLHFAGNADAVGNVKQFDPGVATESEHLVNTLLRQFNFEHAAKWLADPVRMKNQPYQPINITAATVTPKTTTAVNETAGSEKNKDPLTIFWDDFSAYAPGALTTKAWNTYGHDGHEFENATVNLVAGSPGNWVTIPDGYTLFPNFNKPLPATFTVTYQFQFGSNLSNKRSPFYFRLDTYEPAKSKPMDLHDINRNGFQFSIAPSGEAETSKRYMLQKVDEEIKRITVTGLKANTFIPITITVDGRTLAIQVNGTEIYRDVNALPPGITFKRYGWYSGVPALYLGTVFIKSSTAVASIAPGKPKPTVIKEPMPATFETTPYTGGPLDKLKTLPPISYPPGFKSSMPALPVATNKAAISKPAFTFPVRSAALATLTTQAPDAEKFKALVENLSVSIVQKLGADNCAKIDQQMVVKKIVSAKAISKAAIDAWAEGKPTVAAYLLCKAVLKDSKDMLIANNLASFLLTYGYAEKAVPLLLYISKQTNEAAEALANLANAYYNLGDPTTALGYANQSIRKDSLNVTANKVAAFSCLHRAATTGAPGDVEKAIGYLKQSLKQRYDGAVSQLLSTIEVNHQPSGDLSNTNFQEFPMLKRIQLMTMPSDLHQSKDFSEKLEEQKKSFRAAIDEMENASKKIPPLNMNNILIAAKKQPVIVLLMAKAASIVEQTTLWYTKMKGDLEQLFIQDKKNLDTKHNEKIKAINRKYDEQFKKLEGGEGNEEEEEEMERLRKLQCEELNREASIYLADLAERTNQFAQRSEVVSRIFCRDYANWVPIQTQDSTARPFLTAQRLYLQDLAKLLTYFRVVQPCIYPNENASAASSPVKPSQWEEYYCANVKGYFGIGPARVSFNCTSMTVSGGEGWVGEMTLNYREDGTFKNITMAAGVGAEWQVGEKDIAAASASATAMEYITIGRGPDGGVSVVDVGITAGAGISGGVADGLLGEEINLAGITTSFVTSETTISGAVPDALRLK